jgi:hypothetical protein
MQSVTDRTDKNVAILPWVTRPVPDTCQCRCGLSGRSSFLGLIMNNGDVEWGRGRSFYSSRFLGDAIAI